MESPRADGGVQSILTKLPGTTIVVTGASWSGRVAARIPNGVE